MKLIPAIDLKNGNCVRLSEGKEESFVVYNDDPIKQAKFFENEGCQRIHIVDLDATLGRGENIKVIEDISKNISTPIQIAGGLRSEEKISQVLDFASRAVIGTIAMQLKESEQENILNDFIKSFGNERIVISIDHMDGKIVTHGWQNNTGVDLYEATNEFVRYGFTEFLTTNVSKDGTLQGPDLESLKKICQINNCNVIASGGISKIEDVSEVKKINPFGVILGKALYEGLVSIEEAKKIDAN